MFCCVRDLVSQVVVGNRCWDLLLCLNWMCPLRCSFFDVFVHCNCVCSLLGCPFSDCQVLYVLLMLFVDVTF